MKFSNLNFRASSKMQVRYQTRIPRLNDVFTLKFGTRLFTNTKALNTNGERQMTFRGLKINLYVQKLHQIHFSFLRYASSFVTICYLYHKQDKSVSTDNAYQCLRHMF